MSACCTRFSRLTSNRVALPPLLLFSHTLCPYKQIYFPSSTNCHLIKLSLLLVMGIADLPCSGHVRDEGKPHCVCVLQVVFSLITLSRLAKHCNETRRPDRRVQRDRAVVRDHQLHSNRHQKPQRSWPTNTYYIESPATQVGMVWVLRRDGWFAWSTWKGARTITVAASTMTMLRTAQTVMANRSFHIPQLYQWNRTFDRNRIL